MDQLTLDFKNTGSEILCKENIMKKVSPYDIFFHYYGNFTVGKLEHSPFRVDEKPSFGIYVSKRNGELVYNDYRLGGGDCIAFVKYKYGCSYTEALKIINRDFGLNLIEFGKDINKDIDKAIKQKSIITNYKPKPKPFFPIKIKVRNWLDRDKNYWWKKYQIKLETLKFYRVYPLTRFWIGEQKFYTDKLCYGYFFKEGVFKIYQPLLTNTTGKWYSNIDNSIPWQGYHQLPEKADILFITSSLKDVMVLYELGYAAIAPHTEKQIFTKDMYEELKQRFKHIIVYYDNDEAGVTHSTKITKQFPVDYINNPKGLPKDPSDFVEDYSLMELDSLIDELMLKKEIEYEK